MSGAPDSGSTEREARVDARLLLFTAQHPAVSDLLARVLKPGEKVRLLTTGWRSFFVDDVFLGIPTLLGNRTLVVGTDRRLLLVRCRAGTLRPSGYLHEVPRESVLAVMAVPFLSLFTTTGTIRLLGVPGPGKRALAMPHDPSEARSQRPRPLCPACFIAHEGPVESCWRCGVRYRSPVAAGLRSLLLPGWGDAYLQNRAVGLMTALTVAFLWFNVGMFVRAAAQSPDATPVLGEMVSSFLALALGAHLVAALVSFARGRHGLIAQDGALPASPGKPPAEWASRA